jgi:hypothetical protein
MQREMPLGEAVNVDGNELSPEPPFISRGTPPGRTLLAEVAASEPMLPIEGIVVAAASRSTK